MVVFPLLAVGFIMTIIAVLFIICCVALILMVLIQKGRGGGLSAAFGGGMASGILGSKTGDVLTWITIGVVGFFLFRFLKSMEWKSLFILPYFLWLMIAVSLNAYIQIKN